MEKIISELKAEIASLSAKVTKLQADQVEDRLYFKSLGSTLDTVNNQVQTLDKLVEVNEKATEAPTQTQSQTDPDKAKGMSLTELGALYKTDPAAGRKAMEAQGLSLDIGNPWKQRDTFAQRNIMERDPELAKRLRSEAVAERKANYDSCR